MRTVLISAAALVFAMPLSAATTFDSFDNGWYSQIGSHNPNNTNIFTGNNGGNELRSFFVFDLSGAVAADAISITFFGNNGSLSTDLGTETIGLFDFSGSINNLLAGTGGVAAFSDLGSGAFLGQHTINASNGTAIPEFTVNLSPTFVAQFNNAVGSPDQRIALGGALQTISTVSGSESFWSFSSRTPAARLNIDAVSAAVPEPGTWAMMLLGFGFIGGAMRSTKRRQKLTVSYA